MANFRDEVEKAIYDTLNVSSVLDEATGGIWNTHVPPNVKPPCVVFQHISKLDDYPSFTIRGVGALYQIKVVSDSPWPKAAIAIDTLIDSVMQDASLSMSSYSLLWCRRESDINLPEERGSEMWSGVGGLWSIIADET